MVRALYFPAVRGVQHAVEILRRADSFVRHAGDPQICSRVTPERTPFEAEANKLESWKEWVRAASPAVTAAHIDHLYIHVSLQAAKAVLRRKNLTSPADFNAAVKMLK